MKKQLHSKIEKLIELEAQQGVDMNLLDTLRAMAAEETRYTSLDPLRVNTLNTFFKEIKDLFLREVFTADYGVEVTLDAFIVLCFEVGYLLGQKESQLP